MMIRRLHGYLGLLIAPSVLLFALTGAAQIYGLHEAHGRYQPPALLEKLSSVHKDQVFAPGHHHAPPPADAAEGAARGSPPADDDDHADLSTSLLKGFFLAVALCLTLSTCIGVWIGLTQTRRKRLAWLLLASGALIPTGLLLI